MAQRGSEENNIILGGKPNQQGNSVTDFAGSNGLAEPDERLDGEFQEPAAVIFGTDPGTGADSGSAGTASDTSTRRAARRDKGQKRGPRASVPNYLGGFEGLILAVHSGLSAVMHTPEFELDETEAKKLANATDELARFYNVAPSAEVKVWMNFVGAAGAVYAPRFVAIAARKKRDKAEALKPKPAPTVVRPDFGSAFPPGGHG